MAGTVTVACKLPHGLVLQLQEPYKVDEDVMGGGKKEVTRFRRTGDVVVIEGCAVKMGEPHDKHLASGFALTHGVDADFFAKWMEQNKDLTPVARGMIFAFEKPGSTIAEARNRSGELSGLEPVDPKRLPAEFAAGSIEQAA